MVFVVLCPGTPEGSTGSGSGFKASQKTDQRLKVSSDRLGEAGNRTCDPWFTRHSTYPLHHGGFLYIFLNSQPKHVAGTHLVCYILWIRNIKIFYTNFFSLSRLMIEFQMPSRIYKINAFS